METVSHIDALNRRFGIEGVAEVVAGNGGLPKVQIHAPAAEAEVYLYGAHVTRWKPAEQEEVLFLSERSQWEKGKPIRGGIPVCFPWFANKADDASAPKHGFARIREWRLDALNVLDNGAVAMVCVLESDESTRAMWPHQFCLVYRMTLGKTLRMELTMINSGTSTLRFEEALHAYFRVGDVERAGVLGLDGAVYLDKTDAFKEKRQAGELTFARETDNAYMNTEAAVEIMDPVLKRRVLIEKLHSSSTVVWNPWEDLAARLPDFGEDEWRRMLCVEGSNVMHEALLLEPGEEHTMRVTLSVQSH